MNSEVVVHKGRTEILQVNLPYDISRDTILSQIRVGPSSNTTLIAEWSVRNRTDGTDGQLIFTLDSEITQNITVYEGYMDILRISAGEPLCVNSDPIKVIFRNGITKQG